MGMGGLAQAIGGAVGVAAGLKKKKPGAPGAMADAMRTAITRNAGAAGQSGLGAGARLLGPAGKAMRATGRGMFGY